MAETHKQLALLQERLGRRPKILISGDGETETVAVEVRDAGMDVIYTHSYEVTRLVTAALQEGVHAIVLVGSDPLILTEMAEELRESGEDLQVITINPVVDSNNSASEILSILAASR